MKETLHAIIEEYNDNKTALYQEYFAGETAKKSEPNIPVCACGLKFPRIFDKYQAMIYLNMSKSTYYRKVKNGDLVPRKLGNTDYYFESDLEKEYQESLRRGRI